MAEKKEQLSGKALNDVHKILYLANEYPSKSMKEVAHLFEMPAMDINIAVWRAQDLGLLTVNKDGSFTVDNVPDSDKWQFGEKVEYLRSQLIYYFNHMARDEADLEENYLSNLTIGYPAHDVFIVLKQLLADRVLATYTIEDEQDDPKNKGKKIKDVYTFYSLWDNSEQQWGKKQFKDATKLK